MTEQPSLSARVRAADMGVLDRFFGLRDAGTDVRTELEAGFTTFLTMAYILVVNPQILSEAGVPIEGALFATAVSAAIGCILMGLLANYPFALAPGMGLNAYFTYTVVLGMGIPWETALGAVFISGVAFILLTIGRIRELVIRGIPLTIKLATGAGIGLFIAFIGLRNAGIVTGSEATIVTLGEVTSLPVLLALAGLVITAALMARGWKTAIILGIIVTAVAAYIFGVAEPPQGIVSIPDPSGTFLAMDIRGALSLGLLQVVFVFLFVDMFDSVGTLVGLGRQAGYLTATGDLPRAQRALRVRLPPLRQYPAACRHGAVSPDPLHARDSPGNPRRSSTWGKKEALSFWIIGRKAALNHLAFRVICE